MLILSASGKLKGNLSDSLTQQPVGSWMQFSAFWRHRSAPTVCLVCTVLMQARICGACRCRSQPMSSQTPHATRLPIRVSVVSGNTSSPFAVNCARPCLEHKLLQALTQDVHGEDCTLTPCT